MDTRARARHAPVRPLARPDEPISKNLADSYRSVTQVITDFRAEIGADGKVRQNLIRTAKQNGGKLGFLA